MLQSAIEITNPNNDPRIHFVDVHSTEEFVHACNLKKGAVLIFDCHGSHDKFSDVGGLIIGGKEIDVWSLRSEVHLPPIAILSACDTHPMDRSHASTANGLLALGAKTVLATTGPIDTRTSAVFIARLVLRIRMILKQIAVKEEMFLRWSFVVNGMIRMQFVSDVV